MTTDGTSAGEPTQLDRLRRFLLTVLSAAVLFTGLYGVSYVLLGSRVLGVAFGLSLCFAAGVSVAYVLARRGQEAQSATVVGGTFLVTSLLGAPLLYTAAQALLLFPAIAIASILLYLRGRRLTLFIALSLAVGLAITACGLFLPNRVDLRPEIDRPMQFALQFACSCVMLVLVGQSTAHLRRTLHEVLHRNEELRASHERFRSLAAASTQIIWTTDARGLVVEDSPTWRTFTGQSAEQWLGWGWLDAVHPADRERVRAAWADAVAGERPLELEYRLRRASGAWADMVMRGAPVRGEGGKVREWVCSNSDVTDKRHAEAALRETEERSRVIIAALAEGIMVQDATGTIWMMNASAERLLGVQAAQVLGQKPSSPTTWRLMREDGAPLPAEEQPTQAVLRTGAPRANEVVGIERSDGSRLWLSINAQPLLGAEGKPAAVVASFFDVTERKRAEEERSQLLERERKARAEAEAANRLKDEFLATVSHELRTPLTAILGWAKLLSARKLPAERQGHALEVIERNAQAQRALVEDLLDVSRIIAGKLLLELQRVDLVEVVDRAIEAVRPAAQAKEIRLERLPGTVDDELMGDPNRLQQVVWNLLSNAIKFTPRGGQVTVRLAGSGAHRVLEVKDNGEGIPKEFIPHLFERFSQADSSATRVHGGLGLGLAIVRHVVELHGGKVRAESEGRGSGATFIVELPLASGAQVAKAKATERAARAAAANLATPDLTGVRVMVVEDKADAREMLTACLQQFGANVLAAASASEALGSMERFDPGVLVSDIGMPGEDGYALLEKVRGRGRPLPAVALTGFAGADERAKALSAGFQSHVAKPVDPLELARVVAQLAQRA